jgi:hypothetical protein
MDLGEVGWGGVDWIGLDQDRNRWKALADLVLNLPEQHTGPIQYNYGKYLIIKGQYNNNVISRVAYIIFALTCIKYTF